MHMMGVMPSEDDDLLTVGQAARRLQVSIDTIRRWGEAGRLPMSKTPTGSRRFRRADVDAILKPVKTEAGSATVALAGLVALLVGLVLMVTVVLAADNAVGRIEGRNEPTRQVLCEMGECR